MVMMELFTTLSHSHLILPTSRTESILEVAATGNTAVAGRWLFRVDGPQVQLPGENLHEAILRVSKTILPLHLCDMINYTRDRLSSSG